jgi:hypothetical protein
MESVRSGLVGCEVVGGQAELGRAFSICFRDMGVG